MQTSITMLQWQDRYIGYGVKSPLVCRCKVLSVIFTFTLWRDSNHALPTYSIMYGVLRLHVTSLL